MLLPSLWKLFRKKRNVIFATEKDNIENPGIKKILYKNRGEWNIEWQRVTTSGSTSDNEWQWVTKSGTRSDNESLFLQIFLFFE